MDVVRVKDEFSWKSLGTEPDGYLKRALSEERVLENVKFDIENVLHYHQQCLLCSRINNKFLSQWGEQRQYSYHS